MWSGCWVGRHVGRQVGMKREADGDANIRGRNKNRGLLIVRLLGILRIENDKIIPACQLDRGGAPAKRRSFQRASDRINQRTDEPASERGSDRPTDRWTDTPTARPMGTEGR